MQSTRSPDGTKIAGALGLLVLVLALGSLAWDAWWHAHRGFSNHFLTPPHALASASAALVLAQWTWGLRPILGCRGEPAGTGSRERRVALLDGVALLWLATLATEFVGRPNYWRGSDFYLVAAGLFPVVLVAASRASAGRFGATRASLVYAAAITAFYALLSLLPPDGASAPTSGGGGRLVLPHVPLLLVVPALAVDGLVAWMPADSGPGGRLLRGGTLGAAFVGFLLASHWPLAGWLVPRMGAGVLARTWPPLDPVSAGFRTQFWNLDTGTIPFVEGLAVAVVIAAVASGVGLRVGEWLRPTEAESVLPV